LPSSSPKESALLPSLAYSSLASHSTAIEW
jgi:hypothetical protein